MINFKNKSEEQRFVRIANCIIALNNQVHQKSHNDIEFTYAKIFRFLADILSQEEFENLSYYHVSRFIGKLLILTFESEKAGAIHSTPIGMRLFVSEALDLQYEQTQESHEILMRAHYSMRMLEYPEIRDVWSELKVVKKTVDLNHLYNDRDM